MQLGFGSCNLLRDEVHNKSGIGTFPSSDIISQLLSIFIRGRRLLFCEFEAEVVDWELVQVVQRMLGRSQQVLRFKDGYRWCTEEYFEWKFWFAFLCYHQLASQT